MVIFDKHYIQRKNKVKFVWVMSFKHNKILNYISEIGQKDRHNF